MNLGRKPETPETMVQAVASPKMPETIYPSFTLDNEIGKKFLEHYDLSMGDECEVKAKLRVSGLRDDQYGNSVTMEVVSVDHDDGEELEPGMEPSDEDKAETKPKKRSYSNPAVEKLEM